MADTHNWEETQLVKSINRKRVGDAKAVKEALHQIMPKIHDILAQGGTANTNFTLHDSGHAFRVAERMVDIIPDNVLPKLSSYELAFLLLSAYLHDIGMTPAKRKVQMHYDYLMTGEKAELSQDEIDNLQKWLDEEGYDIVPPLPEGQPTIEEIRLVDEIMTYYCRHCHNDWSEEWIRDNLVNHRLGNYTNWIDDLVTVCRSHHEGYNELAKDRFRPRILGDGDPPVVAHLRYLAAVLRIADVLELDPERTPAVVFRHRDIIPGSAIYWWKDHHISLVKEDNRLVLSASPPNAYIHRAIEITANQIDEELSTCLTLADETHFEKCEGLTKDLPHRWDLLSSIHRSIVPQDNAYEYIDGSFRPDTEKLLELLSGVELYGNPLVAVRELLQNAFDAVREQIAYQRLLQSDPENDDYEQRFGDFHSVELFVEERDDGPWLVCKDTGVGMTKAIIRDHLLVSGNARRHDILALERSCKEKGFNLNRTGQFGIGVLSYFMIADKVVIKTIRNQNAGDHEPNGWCFETPGIGSFGELKKEALLRNGTEVHLRLKKEIKEKGIENWFRDLTDYLREALLRIPCKLHVGTELPERDELTLGPGWINDAAFFTDKLVGEVGPNRGESFELLPESRRQELEDRARFAVDRNDRIKQSVKWKVTEDKIPDSAARYRIHMPYYELPNGVSLAFFDITEEEDELILEQFGNYSESYAFIGIKELIMGWKGMRIPKWSESMQEIPRQVIGFIEIDWCSTKIGKLSVRRDAFEMSSEADAMLDLVIQKASQMSEQLASENTNSVYNSVNALIADVDFAPTGPLFWVQINGTKVTWKEVSFPVIYVRDSVLYRGIHGKNYSWAGKPVLVISDLMLCMESSSYGSYSYKSYVLRLPADRIAIYPEGSVQVSPLWEGGLDIGRAKNPVGITALFPSDWSRIVGISTSGSASVWNTNHPLVCSVDEIGWEWTQNTLAKTKDPLRFEQEILEHKNFAASWILRGISRGNFADVWNGIKERNPSFLGEVWRQFFGDETNPQNSVCFFDRYDRLHVLTPEECLVCTGESDIEKYFPKPGPEWYLEVAEKD